MFDELIPKIQVFRVLLNRKCFTSYHNADFKNKMTSIAKWVWTSLKVLSFLELKLSCDKHAKDW